MDPKTSKIDSVSLEQTFVHQKQNNDINLSLISGTLLHLFSKYLSFLSLHIEHHMQAGIILYLCLFLAILFLSTEKSIINLTRHYPWDAYEIEENLPQLVSDFTV